MRKLRISRRWLVAAAVAGLAMAGGHGSVALGNPAIRAGGAFPTGYDLSANLAIPMGGASLVPVSEDRRTRVRRAPAPHADGPPLARTGGFGELTCIECHLDLELNALGGALLIDGVPASFAPGAAYVVTVVVEGEGMGSAGFQAAARFREGERAGEMAGSLAPLDARTIVRGEGGVDYINHTIEGSRLGPGDVASWSFEWVAPGNAAPVVFHVTGNSANGDNSPLGDLIYTTEVVTLPGT